MNYLPSERELRYPGMDGPVLQLRRGVRVHVHEKVLHGQS